MISNFLQSNKIVKVKAVFKDSNFQSYYVMQAHDFLNEITLVATLFSMK